MPPRSRLRSPRFGRRNRLRQCRSSVRSPARTDRAKRGPALWHRACRRRVVQPAPRHRARPDVQGKGDRHHRDRVRQRRSGVPESGRLQRREQLFHQSHRSRRDVFVHRTGNRPHRAGRAPSRVRQARRTRPSARRPSPAAMTERENYYLVLDLDPKVDDPAAIERALKGKARAVVARCGPRRERSARASPPLSRSDRGHKTGYEGSRGAPRRPVANP